MTLKQLYEHVLTEQNKVNAPVLLLSDFNYFANKAIQQYVNKEYNLYEINQQTSDDLRVLKSTAVLDARKCDDKYGDSPYRKGVYETDLPDDYLHILNCTCVYTVQRQNRCNVAGRHVEYGATRLTADIFPTISRNAYNRPQYNRPYYYIHNTQTSATDPRNPVEYEDGKYKGGVDALLQNDDRYTFSASPDIVRLGAQGGLAQFSIASTRGDGVQIGFRLVSGLPDDWSIETSENRDVSVKVPFNQGDYKVSYLVFQQNESGQFLTVAIEQQGSVKPELSYFLVEKRVECKKLIDDGDYDSAVRVSATSDSVKITIDGLDDKRSFGIMVPDGYELYDVRDVLGNSVRAMFGSWTSGYVGHTDNIYYLCSVGAIKNTYTFTFNKKES